MRESGGKSSRELEACPRWWGFQEIDREHTKTVRVRWDEVLGEHRGGGHAQPAGSIAPATEPGLEGVGGVHAASSAAGELPRKPSNPTADRPSKQRDQARSGVLRRVGGVFGARVVVLLELVGFEQVLTLLLLLVLVLRGVVILVEEALFR